MRSARVEISIRFVWNGFGVGEDGYWAGCPTIWTEFFDIGTGKTDAP